jgi:hypothetical protein
MAIPTPGQTYTVKQGDTLERISAIAYGTKDKWRKIYNANQSTLKSDSANLIFPGETIMIPIDLIVPQTPKTIPGADPDSMIVKIEDIEIEITEGSFIRPMDTASDGWTVTAPWDPGVDERFDDLTKPYRDPSPMAEIYLGGILKGTGKLYHVEHGFSDSGRTKVLHCFSLTADAVDSMLKPPYEFSNIKLEQHASALLEPFGIKAIFKDPSGGPFKKIVADKKSTIFSHLANYAAQRSLLISCDEFGNMVFQKANVSGESVGSITEQEQNTQEWKASFNGRERFGVYRVISQTPAGHAQAQVVKDDQISQSRFTTIDAPDTEAGGVKDVAAWARSKALAGALPNSLPQVGWRDPNGELYENNTIGSIESITLGVPSV